MLNDDDVQKVGDIIKDYLRFGNSLYGDTPTDAFQLANKKYVDSNQTSINGAKGSVTITGTGVSTNGQTISIIPSNLEITLPTGTNSGSANWAVCLDADSIYDNSAAFVNQTNGATQSFTMGSGANGLLLVCISQFGATVPAPSSVTYAGVSMTQIANNTYTATDAGGATYHQYIFALAGPTSGTNNVVVTAAAGSNFQLGIWSGTGIAQTVTVDALNNVPQAAGNTYTGTLTTVTDYDLTVVFASTDAGSGGITANSGVVLRTNVNGLGIFDSSSHKVPAGSVSASIHVANVVAGTLGFVGLSFGSKGVYGTAANSLETFNSFIGFVPNAFSANSTTTVIVNGVVSGFSNLSVGSTYYLADATGTISTTPGSNTKKCGIALSATQLVITNLG